jgi:hypothetical protein
MTENAFLDYGAGLLAYALAQAGADDAQLEVGHTGDVVITLRKAGEVLRTGRVPRDSSLVRWTEHRSRPSEEP